MLRFVDRGGDVVLYEPGAAARAKEVLALASSVRCCGDLRRLVQEQPRELVQRIVDHLWDLWEDGECVWFGFDDSEEADLQVVHSLSELLALMPDDRPLEVPTCNGDGEPIFMDPFDPVT
ncbi:MAG: hypothetical protein ACRD0L_01550, partial [Acidimicrobiales bacterium]